MFKKYFNPVKNIIVSFIYFIIGILTLTNLESVWTIIFIMSNILFLLIFIISLINIIYFKKIKLIDLSIMIIPLFFLILNIYNLDIFYNIMHIMFGWWILINGIIEGINAYVYYKDKLKGFKFKVFNTIINIGFGLSLMLVPKHKLWILSLIAGSYFILYGFINLIEGIKDLLNEQYKIKFKRHLSVSLPVFFSAMVPQGFFFNIKKMKNESIIYKNDNYNLEIFVYLKESGPESLGHVDIGYKNVVYSYGCHDPNNRGLFGTLGDGVLVIADRDDFIKNAYQNDLKTIIAYQIKISEKECHILENKIDELLKRAIRWKPLSEIAYDNKTNETYDDYASRVFDHCKCQMFKFNYGKFRTYFVFSTNCVLLADYLVRSDDLNLITTSGIVTPGTYINFLNNELKRPNSCVINRIIYEKEE